MALLRSHFHHILIDCHPSVAAVIIHVALNLGRHSGQRRLLCSIESKSPGNDLHLKLYRLNLFSHTSVCLNKQFNLDLFKRLISKKYRFLESTIQRMFSYCRSCMTFLTQSPSGPKLDPAVECLDDEVVLSAQKPSKKTIYK